VEEEYWNWLRHCWWLPPELPAACFVPAAPGETIARSHTGFAFQLGLLAHLEFALAGP